MHSRVLWLATLAAAMAPAQPPQMMVFRMAPGSPLSVVATELGDSRVQPRGGAMVLDLHAVVTLRNNGPQTVRGVTLVVLAQEMTPGGKGSVAVPSLHVAPGASFPVKINLRLLRPLPAPQGPLVEAALDGVLFGDLSFFGPNKLESRRTLTAWEMEARRDREHFKTVLAKSGPEGLQQEMLASLARQQSRPQLNVEVSRGGGRAISAAVNALTGRTVSLAFLKIPESPLELLNGSAQVNAAETASPRIEAANRSNRAVRYFEVGWLVKDGGGRESLAGTIPAESGSLDLRPGKTAVTQQGTSYRLGTEIAGMSGFVSQVEFADGTIWIPSRRALGDRLLGIVPASPEEQRLAGLYRSKGLQALVEELGKF